jgi:carbon-monoxide dehydrogenase small subunit
MMHRTITLRINGEDRTGEAEPRKLLSDFIREDLGLTGTHVGCEQGVCGACTVLLDVATLHPIQMAFWEKHGLQCGFCTPGMILTTKALLERNPSPTEEEVRVALEGNICRCTGYVFIVESVLHAAELMAEGVDA